MIALVKRGPLLRRTITLLCLTVFGVLLYCLFPPLLVLAVILDLLGHRQMALSRSLLFMVFFVGMEAIGITLALAVWLARLVGIYSQEAYIQANHRIQKFWTTTLFRGGALAFSYTLEVDGLESISGQTPLLIFMRHVSTVDTVLPFELFSNGPYQFRYVLKEELKLDPCLDIVGNRLPNCFVRRGADDSQSQIQSVLALAQGMGPREALVMFPEGTRFSPRKRAKLLERFEQKGEQELLNYAQSLKATLSPLRKGPLALLSQNTHADIVFISHTGLEAAGSFAEFFRGGLVGQRIRVKIWRVNNQSLPQGEAAQVDFLKHHWQSLDHFAQP